MKLARWVGLSFSLVLITTAACGKKASHEAAHGEPEATPAPPPTPDTTPIEALRTPAGLVLKITPAPSM